MDKDRSPTGLQAPLPAETAEKIRNSIERMSNAAQVAIDDYERQETEYHNRIMETMN